MSSGTHIYTRMDVWIFSLNSQQFPPLLASFLASKSNRWFIHEHKIGLKPSKNPSPIRNWTPNPAVLCSSMLLRFSICAYSRPQYLTHFKSKLDHIFVHFEVFVVHFPMKQVSLKNSFRCKRLGQITWTPHIEHMETLYSLSNF